MEFAEFRLPARCKMKLTSWGPTSAADPTLLELRKRSATDTDTPTGTDMAIDNGKLRSVRSPANATSTGLFLMQLSGELISDDSPTALGITNAGGGALSISWDHPAPGSTLQGADNLLNWLPVHAVTADEMAVRWLTGEGRPDVPVPVYPAFPAARYFRILK